MYLVVWPLVAPWDPKGAAAFIPYAGIGKLALLGGCVWLLAIVIGLLTTTARPDGAMMAVVLGIGGISLHSPQMRSLLWQRQSLSELYGQLTVETILLAVIVIVAMLLVGLVRMAVGRVAPSCLWRAPSDVVGPDRLTGVRLMLQATLGLGSQPTPTGANKPRAGASAVGSARVLAKSLLCLGLSALVAVVLLLVLLKSSDRGQVIFAVFGAFFLAMLVGHQVFPSPCGVAAWIVPILIACAFYSLTGAIGLDSEPDAWTKIPFYGRVLPVDWVSAGIGGALLGFWISARMHEAKIIESRKQQE